MAHRQQEDALTRALGQEFDAMRSDAVRLQAAETRASILERRVIDESARVERAQQVAMGSVFFGIACLLVVVAVLSWRKLGSVPLRRRPSRVQAWAFSAVIGAAAAIFGHFALRRDETDFNILTFWVGAMVMAFGIALLVPGRVPIKTY